MSKLLNVISSIRLRHTPYICLFSVCLVVSWGVSYPVCTQIILVFETFRIRFNLSVQRISFSSGSTSVLHFMSICGIIIPRAQATRVTITAPTPIPRSQQKGHHQMAPKPIPHFSDFLSMKRFNPNQYWLPVTAVQMANAYQHHGPAYFDLHKDKST